MYSARRNRRLRTALLCIGAAWLLMAEATFVLGAEPPRYGFSPGQRFEFNSVGELPENVRPDRWTVSVLATEDDGWRLLVRRHNYPVDVATVHISPRGELSHWSPAQADMPVEDIFPLLPAAEDETAWASDGWLPMDYQRSAANAGQPVEIVGKLANRLGQAFVRERTTTWRLDPTRGYVPTEIVARLFAAAGSSDEERRLQVTVGSPLSPQQTAALAKSAEELGEFEARYRTALAAAAQAPTADESAVADAWSDLALARNTISGELRDSLDYLLRCHADQVKEARNHAELLAELRAKPPAEWIVSDLNGQPRRAADYRGRVVVLDFWFARCGPCLRTIPTLQRLRKAFPETEVVLLGCNVDEDVTEARDIVAKVGEHYPTLLARELDKLYGVTAYPTFVILAPDGRVYDSFISEGRPLYQKLSETIRLLNSQQAAK